MAQEKPQNLQDTFLNHVRKQKVPVTVFLVNGVKLQGIVTWFDNLSSPAPGWHVATGLQTCNIDNHAGRANQPV